MDHLIQPLEHLLSQAGMFTTDQGPRLLHVAADGELYREALRTVATLEWSPRNRRHFIDATPESEGPADWDACRERLAAGYRQIRAAYAEQGSSLADLAPPFATDALVGFGGTVLQAAQNLSSEPAQTKGVVVILGMGAFPHRARAAEQITSLVESPALGNVRWALVESGEAEIGGLARCMGPAALSVSCRVDRNRQKQEVDDLLDALASAATAPAGPARAGGARPAQPPPPRSRTPLDPGPGPETAHIAPLLRGAKALRAGDVPRAVQLQREALACCLAASNVAGAVDMEVLLAVYLGQLALSGVQPMAPALAACAQAVARASSAGLLALGARAEMLHGILANAGGDQADAALSLHRAALLAETARAAELHVAASRLAADIIERAGLTARAAELRERALAGEPTARAGTASGD